MITSFPQRFMTYYDYDSISSGSVDSLKCFSFKIMLKSAYLPSLNSVVVSILFSYQKQTAVFLFCFLKPAA